MNQDAKKTLSTDNQLNKFKDLAKIVAPDATESDFDNTLKHISKQKEKQMENGDNK